MFSLSSDLLESRHFSLRRKWLLKIVWLSLDGSDLRVPSFQNRLHVKTSIILADFGCRFLSWFQFLHFVALAFQLALSGFTSVRFVL